jgi:hypothetical protein
MSSNSYTTEVAVRAGNTGLDAEGLMSPATDAPADAMPRPSRVSGGKSFFPPPPLLRPLGVALGITLSALAWSKACLLKVLRVCYLNEA